jgi:RHS repeat-associated protein
VLELGGRNVAYGYDNDYRLTSEGITGDPAGNNGTVNYTQYDTVGNWMQMTSTLNAVPGGSFSYDANDRLTTDIYDANGNTTSSGGITNTYDFENRMLTHGAVSMFYDGDGNRVSETIGGTTTKYLVDTLNPTGLPQVLDEIVNGSVTRTHAYGLLRVSENQILSSTWTPSFYGYDGHGNVRFLTNSSGAVTDSYDYDAFGMPIRSSGSTANNYLYSGERSDSSIGLYDLRARYYNQVIGRFWTTDPVEGVACTPLTYNPYIYGIDDPVDNVDPTGQQAIIEYLLLYHWIQGFQVHPRLKLPCPLSPVKGSNPKGSGTAAYFVCCRKGSLAVCEGPAHSSDPWVDKCRLDHERQHLNDFANWCPGYDCTGVPNGTPVPVPEAYSNRVECSAYCEQQKCLNNQGPTPGVLEERKRVEKKIKETCGKEGCVGN